MVKLWKVSGSMSVSKQVHFFVMEKNVFPLSLVCLTWVHFFIKFFYLSHKHEHLLAHVV